MWRGSRILQIYMNHFFSVELEYGAKLKLGVGLKHNVKPEYGVEFEYSVVSN